MKAIKGYTVITECIGHDELSWSTDEGGVLLPDIYETQLEAEKEIIRYQIDRLQSVESCPEKGDYNNIDWTPDVYVAQILIDEKENLLVWDGDRSIIATTLQNWRNNR